MTDAHPDTEYIQRKHRERGEGGCRDLRGQYGIGNKRDERRQRVMKQKMIIDVTLSVNRVRHLRNRIDESAGENFARDLNVKIDVVVREKWSLAEDETVENERRESERNSRAAIRSKGRGGETLPG